MGKDQRAQPRKKSITRYLGHNAFRAILFCLTIGAIVACLWFSLSPKNNATEIRDHKKKRGAIKTIIPTPKKTVETNQTTAIVSPHKRDRNAGAETYIDEKGVKRYLGGARYFDLNENNRKQISVASPGIFKHYAENQIYALLEVVPGDPIFVTRKFDERFINSFKHSLNDEIEILDTDSEYERKVKEAMIETKADLKIRMDNGEDLCALLQDTYSEITRLAQYKKDIQKMVKETVSENGEMSDADYNDLIQAANKMLAEHGIAPIRNTILLKKNVLLHYQKSKETSR